VLAPGADPQAVADALGYELKKVGKGFVVVETPEGREGREHEDALDADLALGSVLFGEPDGRVSLPEGSQSNPVLLGSELGRADFTGQPALLQIRAERAHRRATGAGVVVAVLDTGVDRDHPLFAELAPGRVLPGFDFVGQDADPADEANGADDDLDGEVDEGFGHGTFVAGLVLGAAPDATLLPVRVLDSDGRGVVSDIVAGIEFAVEQGADVVNLSLGMQPRSEVLGDAVRYALANGVPVVASTGNRAEVATVDFPARVRGAVAVTALDEHFRARATFASASRRTTLGAPGTGLVGPYPGERWATWSGTSFSAALVTGGAALLLEVRPGLAPDQVVRRIVKRARPLPQRLSRAQRRLLGHGRLDLPKLAR